MSYFDDLHIVQTTHKIYGFHITKPLNPPYFSICLLREGEIIVVTDGIRRRLKAPAIFWAIPGHTYQFENMNRRETIWLDMGGSRIRRIWCGLEKLLPFGFLALDNSMKFAELMTKIIQLDQTGKEMLHHRIVVSVEELIGLIYDEALCGMNENYDCSVLFKIAEEFSRNPVSKYDMTNVARDCGMSYDSFRKKFKCYIGQSPYEFLLNKKMDLAADLLHDHRKSIKEIADSCGFRELSCFSRMFKKKTGSYPREFRKKLHLS